VYLITLCIFTISPLFSPLLHSQNIGIDTKITIFSIKLPLPHSHSHHLVDNTLIFLHKQSCIFSFVFFTGLAIS